ncbi:hypothetical protein ACJ73_05168 [Blastomyces percursus]|uniref:Uncharacterized protein n=1 Tax=Blastomyces percursus TaxID=1658174 RepID=A0A1J9R4P4_9EURO|nr:hypothetical protein ACJ73_05168 [Blastomyces percursus]
MAELRDQAGSSSVEPDGVSRAGMTASHVKDLVLGEASKSGKSLQDTFIVRHESPWETLRVYACELAGPFDLAIRHVRPSRLVAIRTFRGPDADRALQRF